LSSLQLSPPRESEIVEELSQHLDDRWRELIAGGASPDEATRLTLAQFRGDDVLAKYMAPLRQAHAPSPITPGPPTEHVLAVLAQSLRHAARILWKQPGFSGVAVLTLALGIGATTAVYSVVNGVLLKPLPFRDPDRLVALYHVTPASQRDIQGAATYFTYREHGQVFEDIGLWQAGNVAVIRSGVPEQVRALRVTDGTLSLLDVRAELLRAQVPDVDVDAGAVGGEHHVPVGVDDANASELEAALREQMEPGDLDAPGEHTVDEADQAGDDEAAAEVGRDEQVGGGERDPHRGSEAEEPVGQAGERALRGPSLV
jgi:hypothetical protein